MKPYTVILLPDDSREPPARPAIEKVRVAHVMALDISGAMACAQQMAADSGKGPCQPIDWAVLFTCEGAHEDITDRPDGPIKVPLSRAQIGALQSLVFEVIQGVIHGDSSALFSQESVPLVAILAILREAINR